MNDDLFVKDKTVEMFLEEFIETLDDPVDQEIVRLGYKGFTQSEIAMRLNYKSQASIAKRLKSIRKKFGIYFDI